MAVNDVLTVFAGAVVALNVVTVLTVVGRLSGRRGGWDRWLRRRSGEVAAVLAAGAMAGSLYLSEVAHLIPCRYCWIQRIAMYPLALVLVIGVATRDRRVRRYAVPMAVIGLGVSTWHYLLQVFPSLEDASACNILNPCTIRYAWKFGFVSIPYMAGSVFAAVLVVLWGRSSQSRIS